MTNIKILKKDYINSIEIVGHTGYDEIKKDIVCASISSIAITSINACLRIDSSSINYKISDGYILVEVLKYNEIINILIENMLSELKELEKKYKKFLKINI